MAKQQKKRTKSVKRVPMAARLLGNLFPSFYDSAGDTAHNHDLFERANDQSADAQNNATARRTIRNNARYEVANNGWLKGISRTVKNDLVGTGPRIQITDDRLSEDVRTEIENKFQQWALDNNLARKLRTQVTAKREDGEGIGVLFPIADDLADQYPNPVKLGYRLLDCDRLTRGIDDLLDDLPNNVDGVQLNRYGDPIRYEFLKEHPGHHSINSSMSIGNEEKTTVDAKWVFHLFDESRPEQHRGVSELQPSLITSGTMRQYLRAVLKAARNVAMLGGFIKTNLPPIVEESEGDDTINEVEERCEPGDEFELSGDVFKVLPEAYDFGQLDAKQPGSTHGEFVKQTVTEIGRPSGVPSNKSRGTSEDHNYASGRLDHQDWHKTVKVERFDLEVDMLDRMFAIWWDFAVRTEGYLSQAARDLIAPGEHPPAPAHKWHWDGFEHVDPNKEAQAQTERFRNGTDHLADAWARQGKVWSKEIKCAAESFGVTPEVYLENVRGYLWKPQTESAPLSPDAATEVEQMIEEMVA